MAEIRKGDEGPLPWPSPLWRPPPSPSHPRRQTAPSTLSISKHTSAQQWVAWFEPHCFTEAAQCGQHLAADDLLVRRRERQRRAGTYIRHRLVIHGLPAQPSATDVQSGNVVSITIVATMKALEPGTPLDVLVVLGRQGGDARHPTAGAFVAGTPRPDRSGANADQGCLVPDFRPDSLADGGAGAPVAPASASAPPAFFLRTLSVLSHSPTVVSQS